MLPLSAFDASSGEQLWKYDPRVPGSFVVKLCCGIVNRGMAAWGDSIIWGTLDGRLVSVNAATGELEWERQVTDTEQWHSITGAPRIANGNIFIGEAGFEQPEGERSACSGGGSAPVATLVISASVIRR